jgi:hypothetical protein
MNGMSPLHLGTCARVQPACERIHTVGNLHEFVVPYGCHFDECQIFPWFIKHLERSSVRGTVKSGALNGIEVGSGGRLTYAYDHEESVGYGEGLDNEYRGCR